MTGSFYESLGRASSAPPDISKTNYLETSPDMLEAVNKNIDRNQKELDAHFDHLIGMWNKLHEKRADRPQELLDMVKQGEKDIKKIDEFQKYWDKYYGLAKPLKAKLEEIKAKYPPGSAEYQQAMRTIGYDFDKDIKTEIDNEEAKDNTDGIIEGAAGVILNQGDGETANELTNLNQKDIQIRQDLDSLIKSIPKYYERSNVSMRFPGFRTGPDGEDVPITYDEATPSEKAEIRMLQNAWFAYAHEGVVEGRVGLFKRSFITKLLNQESLDYQESIDTFTKAQVQIAAEQRSERLSIRLQDNPMYIITDIKARMNHPESWDEKGNVHAAIARDSTTEDLIKVIQNEDISNFQYIETFLTTPFKAHDGSMVTPEKYWPEMAKKLRKAMNDRNKADTDRKKEEQRIKETGRIKEFLDRVEKGEIEWKDLDIFVTKFRQDFSYVGKQLPEHAQILETIQYRNREEDHWIAQKLRWWAAQNMEITFTDLIGIEDLNLRKKLAEELIGRTGALKREGTEAGTISYRDRAIKGIVTDHTVEWDADPNNRSLKWISNYEQATNYYNQEYAKALAIPGATAYDAHTIAIGKTQNKMSTETKKVIVGINQKTKEPIYAEIPIWDTRGNVSFKVDEAKQILKTVDLINNNRELLNQSTPYDGEEDHLKAAAIHIDKMSKGATSQYPEYYRELGRRLHINPLILMRDRLRVNGILSPDDFTLVEEGKPGERLLSTNISSGRTIRAYMENGNDVSWMLKTSQNPDTVKAGGYTAIRDPGGKYKNIEEVTGLKLEEITLRDVLELAGQGYDNIGMYDLRVDGFSELLQASGLPLDIPWNQANQDVLYLARLKQKAQLAQKNTGVNVYYRRVVNLDQELLKRFTDAVGELPPMLNPTNLQADVAKEYIKMLTEE